MIINIPQHFYKQEKFNYINIDDITLIDYKIYSSNEKVYAFSHTHLLIFILNGTKKLSNSEGELEAGPGEFIFVNKGNYIMNQIVDLEEGKYESIIICLGEELLNEFSRIYTPIFRLDRENELDIKSFHKFRTPDFINMEMKTLLSYFLNKNRYTKEILKLKIFEILLNIINDDNCEFIKRWFKDVLLDDKSDFKRLMEENYDKPLSVEEIAKISGRSLTTFKNHFKKIFSDTPQNWITQKRLKKAGYLLNNSEYNITEICYLVGFKNLSHFIRLFKKKYNSTPHKFRNIK